MKPLCKILIVASVLMGCIWGAERINNGESEAPAPPVVEEEPHRGDLIADGIKECGKAHMIMAFFPGGDYLTLDLPAWDEMIELAKESGNTVNPESVIREYIRESIDRVIESGAVEFGVVHTPNEDLSPNKRAGLGERFAHSLSGTVFY